VSEDPGAPTHVLVVDDDPVSLLVSSHILEAGEFTVSRASSAAEARLVLVEAAISPAPVSLIVCDHLMPDETGLDLLAGLDQIDAPTARFILLTGVSSREDLDDPRTDLVEAFLTKPVQSATLLEAANAALAGTS